MTGDRQTDTYCWTRSPADGGVISATNKLPQPTLPSSETLISAQVSAAVSLMSGGLPRKQSVVDISYLEGTDIFF